MISAGPFNATRHPQKPLPQPAYNFSQVPKAKADLEGSTLHRIVDRDHFHECMAEMLLLCKEAMRRRPGCGTTGGAKPLSLEYLADRLDIDDPCFGYLVRTDGPDNKGMLQGFITVTTFTNWQRSFRWDSAIDAAYECDSDELIESLQERKRDEDGGLARGLQKTVRCGDINMEGIVWPRICEISLLGGLGCGRTLVNLIIEELECMKASARANYDYVVLQATDNSIPFYESMGFVRVGAVMLDESEDGKKSAAGEDDTEDNPFVTSKIMSYTVRTGETLTRIALKFQVDVWDLIFLNRCVLGDAKPADKPKLGTLLMIPAEDEEEPAAQLAPPKDGVQWHVAKENETPRTIAKLYDVNCLKIVDANKGRLPGLLSNSRLKEGTRIKVSHLHIPEKDYTAYAHWSFPDARFEDPEPSYMMVRKLNRRRKASLQDPRPVESSLKAPILEYEPPPLLLPPSPTPVMPRAASLPMSSSKARTHPREPVPPSRPQSAYIIYLNEQRELARDDIRGLPSGDTSKIFLNLWNNLPASVKAGYEKDAEYAKRQYESDKEKYKADLEAFLASKASPSDSSESGPLMPDTAGMKYSLYNKVVRLRPDAITEGSQYKYWYVLTFIPDLKWCHLAPMVQCGKFGDDKPKAKGRPKWKLVDEKLGKEVDISSSYCIPIKSRSMRKTLDADLEEWDIIDDGTDPAKVAPVTPRLLSVNGDFIFSGGRPTTAVKPSAERVRKRRSSSAELELPLLGALLPGMNTRIAVRIVGKKTFAGMDPSWLPRKRGRPVGRKNYPKTPSSILKSPPSSTATMVEERRTNVQFKVPGNGASPQKPSASPMKTKPSSQKATPLVRAGPSPGGILRRRNALAALEESAEKRERKAPEPASPLACEPERKRVSVLRKPTESLNLGDGTSDSSDTSYSESSASSNSDDPSAESDSDVDSVGAVVMYTSPRRSSSRHAPAPAARGSLHRSPRKPSAAIAAAPSVRTSLRLSKSDTIGTRDKAGEQQQQMPWERTRSPRPELPTRRAAVKPSSVTRSTRNMSADPQGICRKSSRKPMATNFYVNEYVEADAFVQKHSFAAQVTQRSPLFSAQSTDFATRPKRKSAPVFLGEKSTRRVRRCLKRDGTPNR